MPICLVLRGTSKCPSISFQLQFNEDFVSNGSIPLWCENIENIRVKDLESVKQNV